MARLDGSRLTKREKFYVATLRGFCEQHPCIGARAAVSRGTLFCSVYSDMHSIETAWSVLNDFEVYFKESAVLSRQTRTLALIFTEPIESQREFETKYWKLVQTIHDIDMLAGEYDPNACPDASQPNFELSFGGHSVFTTTLNPTHPLFVRKFGVPVWVCNQASQFEALTEIGSIDRWQERIREAGAEVEPPLAPNTPDGDLKDFHHRYDSVLAQLAGSAIDQCPFLARKSLQERRQGFEVLRARAAIEQTPKAILDNIISRSSRLYAPNT